MRRSWMLLLALVAVLCCSGVASAALITIGTATYGVSDYNLIYEEDQGLVWLDYTKGGDTWQNQVNWASGLGGSLTVTLHPDYTTNIDWSTGWRLPETVNGPYVWGYDGTTTAGYNITNSEMGHLYYTSLGNLGYFDTSGNPQSGWGLQNTGPFNNLLADVYWSGTEYLLNPNYAWNFGFMDGPQANSYKGACINALAVRPGEVSAVPVPASVFLLVSGLAGLVGLRKKFGR
jgi:hypothetical protein